MSTSIAMIRARTLASMVLVFCLGTGTGFSESTDDAALLVRLKTSKHSLADAIAQTAKASGLPTSAKFEMKGDTLMLSVYAARKGPTNDAEHNELIELIGDAAKERWTPDVEVFEDKAHLTRSAMHLTVVQTSPASLLQIIEKVQAKHSGVVYSIIPGVKNGQAVVDVKIASGDKSNHLVVDARTGSVRHDAG